MILAFATKNRQLCDDLAKEALDKLEMDRERLVKVVKLAPSNPNFTDKFCYFSGTHFLSNIIHILKLISSSVYKHVVRNFHN